MFYKPALELIRDKNDDRKWYYGTWIIKIEYMPKINFYRAMAWNKVGWKRWLKMGSNSCNFSAANNAAMHIDMREGREGSF